MGGLSGCVAHGGDHAGDGLTIPKESPDKALLLRAVASTVSCRGDSRGCCCLSPSSCSKAARNGFRETGRSLLLWLLLTGEPRGAARPGEGMAGDALRGLRKGLLELRLRFRVRPGPGLASVLRGKRLVSESEDGDGGQCHGKAREPHMKDRNLALAVKSGDLLIRGTYQEQSAGQATCCLTIHSPTEYPCDARTEGDCRVATSTRVGLGVAAAKPEDGEGD